MSPQPVGNLAVVITAYNCARYLSEAIASVLGQSRPAQQVIVLDDGSQDNCAEVTRSFGERVQYHRQSNAGSAAARNTGVRLAEGDWLALLDGDDYWSLDKLAAQAARVAAEPALEAVFCHVQQFVSQDLDPELFARFEVPPDPMPAFYASTMLIRREALARVGAFDEQLHISEFVDWFSRAQDARLRYALLPETLVWRRVHANNSTRRQRDQRQEYVRVMKRLLDRRRQAGSGDSPAGPDDI